MASSYVSTEQRIYRELLDRRRLGFLKYYSPAAVVLIIIFIVNISPSLNQLHMLWMLPILFTGAFFILISAVTAWLGMGSVASTTMLLSSIIGLTCVTVIASTNTASNIGAYSVVAIPTAIVGLALLVGDLWIIPVMTLLSCGLSGLVAFMAIQHPGADVPLITSALVNTCIDRFMMGGLIFVAARMYQRIATESYRLSVDYERARQLDDLKDQFIASVNHELRNPIMLMHGYVELLRLKGQTLEPERQQALVDRSAKAGENLVALLNSILDLNRVDQDAENYTPASVPVREQLEVAANLVDPREANMVERELRVSIPEGTTIWGDAIRLQQILTNLLSNAVKYSEPGTPIEIHAGPYVPRPVQHSFWRWRGDRTEAPSEPMLEITVRDYGKGIPPDQIPLLFKRFVRLPRDLASSVIGNGLGLFLCRTYAEAMHGRIWVESEGIDGKGSTFHLIVPIAPPGS